MRRHAYDSASYIARESASCAGRTGKEAKMSAVQHIFRGERLQAFSDAVFAIVATIMVIPLKLNIEEGNIPLDYVLQDHLYSLYPRYLVYLFSFVLVVDTWYSHARIFSVVEQVDDVIMWLNLLSLLFITFLPYGTGLISHFQASRPEGFELAISTCSAVIFMTGLIMVVMLLYAFRKQALLHPEVADNSDIRSLKIGLLITLSVNPLLALGALFFSFFQTEPTQIISLVFFYSMGLLGSLVVRTLIHLYHHRRRYALPHFATTIFRTVASKSRTEAFSDGVFSIVATLIVLDFTTTIPTSEAVKNNHGGNLRRALETTRFIYLSYVASFCIVGLLWLVQYGMFHFLKKITPTLSFLNTLTLCLVGGIPFVSSIYVAFINDNDENAQKSMYSVENQLVAMRASVVLVFLVGISQLLFWSVALNHKSECLSEEADRYPAEILMFVKIMIIPTVSGVLFGVTFIEGVSAKHVYGFVIVATPFVFLLVKFVFLLHDWMKSRAVKVKEKVLRLRHTRRDERDEEHTPTSSPVVSSRRKPSISAPINTLVPEQVPLKAANC